MPVSGFSAWILSIELDYVKKALRQWNRIHFSFIKDYLRSLTSSLDKVQQDDPTPSDHELELSLKAAIHEQLLRE